MAILAIYNIKGGVGKTAASVNLSHCAARAGARVLVWDLDPQGASTFTFRIKPRVKGGARKLIRGKRAVEDQIKGADIASVDLLPADFRYRHLDLRLAATPRPERLMRSFLRLLAREYDHVLVDCAPGISLVSECVLRAVDAVLVPLIPTTLSVRTYKQLVQFLERKKITRPAVMPFLSIVDRRKRLHRELVEHYRAFGKGFLKTVIPNATEVEQMALRRAPVRTFAPNSVAAHAYEAMWREITERLT